jgi:hypothetical protein
VQGLVFNSTVPGLQFGLVQFEGGPCGILAAVQAHVLAALMGSALASTDLVVSSMCFASVTWWSTILSTKLCPHPMHTILYAMQSSGLAAAMPTLEPNPRQQQQALVVALSDILWQARAHISTSSVAKDMQ